MGNINWGRIQLGAALGMFAFIIWLNGSADIPLYGRLCAMVAQWFAALVGFAFAKSLKP